MFRGQLFIFLVIHIHISSCAISAVYDAGREIWKLYSIMNNMEMNTTHNTRIDEPLNHSDTAIQELRNQIEEIHERLNQIEGTIYSKRLRDSFKSLPSDIMVIKCMDTFDLFIQKIDDYYNEFHQNINESGYHSNPEFIKLSRRIIFNVEGDIAIIRKILENAVEFLPNYINLASAIAGYVMIKSAEICDGPYIISKILIQLFNTAIIAEIKYNIMSAFVNIHGYRQHGEWKNMNSLTRKQLEKQFGVYVNIFAMNIDMIEEAYLRACDPVDGIWTRNRAFYELEGTFQATIFRHHWARCKHDSCNNVWFNKRDRCDPGTYDYRSSCSNTVAECTYLNTIQACVLKKGPHKFQYVKSKELGLLGRNSTCPRDNGYMIQDGTGWDFNYAACVCNCYGDHNKITLMIMNSRVKFNMVIIGLRFIRKDRVLYIQPREGKLADNGYIMRYSQRWIPIPNNIQSSLIHPINRKNRFFFLDDLRLLPSYVLTGVQFNQVTRENVTGFAIKIYGLPFHYKSGKLFSDSELLKSKEASNKYLGKGLAFNAVSSAYTTLPHTLSPSNIKYVSLERSTLQDDFGQSTLPLFDAVPVRSDFPSPLGGIGIIHKGVPGYAGFISLRVYGIKYAKYFRDFKFDHMHDDRVSFNDSCCD